MKEWQNIYYDVFASTQGMKGEKRVLVKHKRFSTTSRHSNVQNYELY